MSENRKSSLPYVKDILDSIEKIDKFTAAMKYDQFLEDAKTQDAVIRNLEVIGEAVKNIPDVVKEKFSAVPFQEADLIE